MTPKAQEAVVVGLAKSFGQLRAAPFKRLRQYVQQGKEVLCGSEAHLFAIRGCG